MDVVEISAYDEFVEFITSSPSLEQIAQFRLSANAEARISELLTANRTRRLTDAEEAELDEVVRLEHMVRKAKIRAVEKLDQRS
ncbi:MAG: hypothetical protein K8S97_01940 [Anaerolineae bacterium]|nr:hypothetical protein [Anaerolineae bacterium]